MPVMSSIEFAFCRSGPWSRLAAEKVLPWALQGAELDGDLLELGGGSGSMAAATADLYPSLSQTVTDIDPRMVAAAQGRLQHLDERVVVREADVTDLPFPDQTFDVVACYLMLHHVIDWRPALHEARRVLKPGGRFVGYDLQRTLATSLLHTVDRSPFALVTRDELQGGLDAVGFDRIAVDPALGSCAMRFSARR